MRTLTACLFCLILATGVAFDVAGPQMKGGRRSLTNAASITQIADSRFDQWRKPEPNTLDYMPPQEIREWYYNHGNPDENGERDPEGDCVQCAIGKVGIRNNNLTMATLPWDSPFGSKIRGASGPDRVAEYCRARQIKIHNVTGRSINDTYPWLKYAADTGRGAAFGFGKNHFQKMMGYDGSKKPWLVCDNNTPWRVDHYTEKEFIAKHAACCFWVVVPDGPAPPPPVYGVIPARKRSWSLWQLLEQLL